MRLRIDLAYDGTPFHGFARQPGGLPTVQGALEVALARLLGGDVATTGAGRTDRGVHATAQVVHLDAPPSARLTGDLDDLRQRLDRLVGDAVTIWAVRTVPDAFDARFSATQRTYRYRIADRLALHPLRRFDVWHRPGPLALAPMRAAARELVGEHDFASFCRAAEGRTTVRRVDVVTVGRDDDGVVGVVVRGPAFCHQQVRSMVGALVVAGDGTRDPRWVGEVLAARDRAVAPPVAPAHGLTLERVAYGRRWPAAPPRAAR